MTQYVMGKPLPDVPQPKSKARKVCRILAGSLLIAVVLLSLGTGIIFLSMTFVPWWIPVLVALVAGVVVMWPLRGFWRWLLGTDDSRLSMLCSIVAVGSISLCGVLLTNYIGASESSQAEIKAEITEKVRKTKHHTRRVGRRTYTTGQVYYVYELSLSLSDGRKTTIDVSLSDYNRARTGDSIGVSVATGLLGWDVIDTRNLVFPERHRYKRKRPVINYQRARRQASQPESSR